MTDDEKALSGDAGEEGAGAGRRPLFSAFKPKPKPPPRPAVAPSKPSPHQETPPAPPPKPTTPPPEPPRQQDAEILGYLKGKVAELESKLRESQEKGLSFAFELKAREEARKESRREMEEFLGAVRQQQASAEADRQRAAEQDRYRERIASLEKALLQLTEKSDKAPEPELEQRLAALEQKLEDLAAKPAPPDRYAEIFSKIDLLEEKLRASIPAIPPQRLSAELEILRDRLQNAENLLLGRQEQLRKDLEERISSQAAATEREVLETARIRFENLVGTERDELARLRKEFRSLRELMQLSAGETLTALDLRLAELKEAVRQLSSAGALSGAEAERTVRWLQDFMEREGESETRKAAGAYDFGYIRASLENLENTLGASLQALERPLHAGEKPGPETLKEVLAEVRKGLENFKAVRAEALRGLRRRLLGE